MKIIKYFLPFMCCCTLLKAQTPELVTDFNVGEEDSFNEFYFKPLELNDRFIFPIISTEAGEELGVLNNGELSILKDINPGSESSYPRDFVYFNDKIYFSAFDEINGGSIWMTDGTEENTDVFLSFGVNNYSKPQGLITSRSGWLYYTCNKDLYKTNGTVNDLIFTEVDFYTEFLQASNNYSRYKEEIAFLVEDNNFVKLYTIEADSVVLLATSEETSNFPMIFGLSEVSEGLIFGINYLSSRNDTSGTYVYNSNTGNLDNITIGNGYASRLHSFTEEVSLSLTDNLDYYLVNGKQDEEILLFDTDQTDLYQGVGIPYGVYEDKLIFHASSKGFWGEDYIFYTIGPTFLTRKLFEVTPYISNFLVYKNHAFISSGVSNFFMPKLFYINMEDGSYSKIFNFDQSSLIPNSILLFGVQDNKLYFLSNLDLSIGRELYSIDIDIATNIINLEKANFDIKFANTSYTIIAEDFREIKLSFYAIDGRLLKLEIIRPNIIYELPTYRKMYFMHFQIGNHSIVHKLAGSN